MAQHCAPARVAQWDRLDAGRGGPGAVLCADPAIASGAPADADLRARLAP